MNVLLIFSSKNATNPLKPLDNQCDIQFGISSISSVLQSKGHVTDLFVVCRKTVKSDISRYIREFKPNLICFSSVFSEYDLVSETASYIKNEFPDIFLLIGGVHASLNPEEVIADSFDGLCINEGEEAVLEFAEKLQNQEDLTSIDNIWVKSKGEIYRNPVRNFIQDLDSIPFPDRRMWQKWIKNPRVMHSILLGRGCPFECTYCCNHVLKKLAGSKYVRYRSPDNILAELSQVVSDYPDAGFINLRVETIGIDKEFTLDLCHKLEEFNSSREKKLKFEANMRIFPNCDYKAMFAAMQKANFSNVCIGLESGSERVRREILNRNYTNEDYFQVVELAKEYGLKVNVYILIGVPGETVSDFRETVYCARRTQPNDCWHSIFFPYPGTSLFSYCQKHGLLPENLDSSAERVVSVLDLPGFSRKQIQKEHDLFYYKVYRGYKPLGEIWRVTLEHKSKNSTFYRILKNITFQNFISRLHAFKHRFIEGGIFNK